MGFLKGFGEIGDFKEQKKMNKKVEAIYTAAMENAALCDTIERTSALVEAVKADTERKRCDSQTAATRDLERRMQELQREAARLQSAVRISKAAMETAKAKLAATEQAKRALIMQNEAIKEKLKEFPCDLCTGLTHPVEDMFVSSCCRRRSCREMQCGWFRAEIEAARLPIRCVFFTHGCKETVLEDQLSSVLPDEFFTHYLRLWQKKIQEMTGAKFCRAVDCQGVVFEDDLGLPNSESTAKHHFVCTVNHAHQWCLTCDAIWHKGQACNEYQANRAKRAEDDTNRLVAEMGWARCPGCGNGVERIEGCNAMKCRCGAGFCYLCSYLSPTGDAHKHFEAPGKCYGKLFQGLGDAYDQQ